MEQGIRALAPTSYTGRGEGPWLYKGPRPLKGDNRALYGRDP